MDVKASSLQDNDKTDARPAVQEVSSQIEDDDDETAMSIGQILLSSSMQNESSSGIHNIKPLRTDAEHKKLVWEMVHSEKSKKSDSDIQLPKIFDSLSKNLNPAKKPLSSEITQPNPQKTKKLIWKPVPAKYVGSDRNADKYDADLTQCSQSLIDPLQSCMSLPRTNPRISQMDTSELSQVFI